MKAVDEFVNFELTTRELLSGEVLFYLPVDRQGVIVGAPDACLLKAYLFNWVKNTDGVIPCSHSEWDNFALCLHQKRMGHAFNALGKSAKDFDDYGYGRLQRFEPGDLQWEVK